MARSRTGTRNQERTPNPELLLPRDHRRRHRSFEEEDRECGARGAVGRAPEVLAPRAVLVLQPEQLVRALGVPVLLADRLAAPQDAGALHAVEPVAPVDPRRIDPLVAGMLGRLH